MTTTEAAPVETSNKFFSIVMFLVLGLSPLYWYMSKGHINLFEPAEPVADVTPGVSDWFLSIRLPEAPFDEAGAHVYETKLAGWLAAIHREGFHPMLLSDVYEHLSRGMGLPDKTLVLTFEPGYGHTYQIVAPILSWYKTPAVWITNAAAIKRSNRRYVSNYRVWLMKRSGSWDVGFYQNPKTLTIDRKHGQFFFGGEKRPVWTAGPVTHALNEGKAMNLMNRLKVSPQWTDRELATRLLNEVPIRGTSQLSARQIGDRPWGVSLPGSSFSTSLLSLKASLDKRAVSVSWPGTQGLNDFDLQLDVASVVGELWLLIHSDREKQESLRVGFTQAGVIVESEQALKRQRLALGSANGLRHGEAFTATVSVHRGQLRVLVNGNEAAQISSIPEASPKSILEMMVYSKIRGTAAADGIRMIFNPQSSPASQSKH